MKRGEDLFLHSLFTPSIDLHILDLMQRIASTGNRILLIDDTPINVDAAKQRGWKGLHYGDFTQLKLGSPQWLIGQLGFG